MTKGDKDLRERRIAEELRGTSPASVAAEEAHLEEAMSGAWHERRASSGG